MSRRTRCRSLTMWLMRPPVNPLRVQLSLPSSSPNAADWEPEDRPQDRVGDPRVGRVDDGRTRGRRRSRRRGRDPGGLRRRRSTPPWRRGRLAREGSERVNRRGPVAPTETSATARRSCVAALFIAAVTDARSWVALRRDPCVEQIPPAGPDRTPFAVGAAEARSRLVVPVHQRPGGRVDLLRVCGGREVAPPLVAAGALGGQPRVHPWVAPGSRPAEYIAMSRSSA